MCACALTRVVEERLDEDPLVLGHLPQLPHQLLQPLFLFDAQVPDAVGVSAAKEGSPIGNAHIVSCAHAIYPFSAKASLFVSVESGARLIVFAVYMDKQISFLPRADVQVIGGVGPVEKPDWIILDILFVSKVGKVR